MPYSISINDPASKVREGLNLNASELSTTRREWFIGYDGNVCRYMGKDYNLVPGGDRRVAPGNGINWVEATVVIPGVPVSAGAKVLQRGSLKQLRELPIGASVDEFAVEGEPVNSDDVDMNGHYLRIASLNQYIWCRL